MAIFDVGHLANIANPLIQEGLLEPNALIKQLIDIFGFRFFNFLGALFRNMIRFLHSTEQTRVMNGCLLEALLRVV